MNSVGIVGMGLVGTAIAKRLSAAGYGVLGYDIRSEACTASLTDISKNASSVVLAVFETKDVLSVLDELLKNDGIRTVVDCSTGDPQALSALALRLAKRGIDFIEAPLSGSSQQIENGEATMLLGGTEAAIAANEKLLSCISPKRLHAGRAGMGANAKLATNLVLGLNRAALAEGMVFAQTLGIDPAKFLELVLQTPANSGAAKAKGQMMVDGNFEPQSRIRQHLKDVDLMLRIAEQSGQNLPLSQAHARLMRTAVEAGDGDLDNAAIIRQIKREKI